MTAPVSAEKPNYTLTSGKGWAVCETYLKFLNATAVNEEMPMCDLKLKRVPGMLEPDWEELDISNHLGTVHQIELLLGVGHIEPAPEQDFGRWKVQREARTNANGERPRLRRTRLALVPGTAVEVVLSYDVDLQSCEKEVRRARQRISFKAELGQPNFFVYDEVKHKVSGTSYWTTMARGFLVLFQRKPYFLNLVYGWDGARDAGRIRISRFEPVSPSVMQQHDFPNDPLYDSHELCSIRFDNPFQKSIGR